MPMPLGLVIPLQAEVSEGHASNQSPRDANHAPHTHTGIHPPMVQVGSEGQGGTEDPLWSPREASVLR